LRSFKQRVRRLWPVWGFKDAFRVALAEGKNGEIQLRAPFSGRPVTLRTGTSDLTCFEKVFLTEEYRSPFPAEPKIIVDAGANIGMATLFYSQAYPQARILSIEPESSNFNMLVKNCGYLPNVTLVQGALWCEERDLLVENPNAEKWAFSVVESHSSSRPESRKVAALTIPGILKRLGASHIDILKLDIEGAEHELFRNGTEAWLDAVRQIVIEFHDRFRPGCAQGFYAALGRRPFVQETRGESIFVKLDPPAANHSS
jgi:FkbM family methyltransferase